MPTNLSEFEDDTAFERYVLDRVTPLLPRVAGTSVIELGDGNSTSVAVGVQPVTVHVGVVDSTGSGGDQLSPDDIRPLLFGAAWKILDQLVELGLELANVAHDRRWDYSISLKVCAATRSTVTAVPPFDGRSDLWTRVMHIARARRAVGGVSHYDLEIHLPDGRILAGPLEDAPNGPATFSVDDPPTWLRWA